MGLDARASARICAQKESRRCPRPVSFVRFYTPRLHGSRKLAHALGGPILVCSWIVELLRHSAAPCRLYTWACCVRCVPPRMDDMYEDPRHDHVYTLVSAPRLDDYTFTRTHYTFTRCAYARTALQSPPLRPASRFPYPTTPLTPCAALHQLHLRRAARPCARHASAIGSIHHARPNRASVRGGR